MKALVCSKSFGKHSPESLALLADNGIETVWISKPSPAAADIAKEIRGCDCLIVGNDPVNAEVLDAEPRLKLVHMHGTGLDAIDVPAASQRGILVGNAPGANRNAVAELSVALLLCAARSVVEHSLAMREGRWERSAGREISGKTLGVIGLGNIGKRTVELLAGFGMHVIAYDPAPDREWAAKHSVTLLDGPDAAFSAADFLVLAAPLTPDTAGIVDERRLGLMKPNAYLVNTARGGLVDEAAVAAAVKTGRIAGAAIDAFSEEPLPLASPLRIPGITLTPHLAASSIETAGNVSLIVARNVVAALIKGDPSFAVNAAELKARIPSYA